MRFRYVFAKTHNILKLYRNILWCSSNNNKGAVKVLIYHDIPESKLEIFHNQIKTLHSDYHFLTPDKFHSFITGDSHLSGLNLLVTFDDGFQSSKIAAEKVLGPLGIKALFFVTVNFIGLSDEQQWKLFVSRKICDGNKFVQHIGPEHAPMSWQDLFWLKDNGHTIGSHTLNHSKLSSQLSEDVLISEIIQSGDILTKKLNTTIEDFAFPFGNIESISSRAILQIRKKYKYCFSGIRGLNRPSTHSIGILRDPVNFDDTTDYLKFQIENGLSCLYYKKSKVLQNLIKQAHI